MWTCYIERLNTGHIYCGTETLTWNYFLPLLFGPLLSMIDANWT